MIAKYLPFVIFQFLFPFRRRLWPFRRLTPLAHGTPSAPSYALSGTPPASARAGKIVVGIGTSSVWTRKNSKVTASFLVYCLFFVFFTQNDFLKARDGLESSSDLQWLADYYATTKLQKSLRITRKWVCDELPKRSHFFQLNRSSIFDFFAQYFIYGCLFLHRVRPEDCDQGKQYYDSTGCKCRCKNQVSLNILYILMFVS